jgi:hypothetical protein
MRTLFERSWVRDRWSPNLGQTPASGSPLADIAVAAGSAAKSYFDSQAAEDAAKAKVAQTQAQIAAQAAAAQAAALAAMNQPKILGMDPSTAAVVGLAGVAAIIAVVMMSKKK